MRPNLNVLVKARSSHPSQAELRSKSLSRDSHQPFGVVIVGTALQIAVQRDLPKAGPLQELLEFPARVDAEVEMELVLAALIKDDPAVFDGRPAAAHFPFFEQKGRAVGTRLPRSRLEPAAENFFAQHVNHQAAARIERFEDIRQYSQLFVVAGKKAERGEH